MTLAERRAALLADRSLRGRSFADAWRAEVDAWLVGRYAEVTGTDPGGPTPGLALVAVGGYGRGDLAPASDLDLLLLHDRKVDPADAARIWYPIWDEGLKLGHSVRTVAGAVEFAADDLDTATSLLTIRPLAGDEALVDELEVAASEQWRKKARRSLGALRRSVLARQAQYGEVAFLLEPDLKEGRGGLRDVHALRWAERARAVLEPGDAEALEAAEDVLFSARVELHRATGRASDQLSLQDQDAVAEALGQTADELMADIARSARRVAWIADETWDRAGASLSTSPSLLGWRSRERAPGLVVRDGQVHLETSADPAAQPLLLLDAAVLAARKRARISRPALERFGARSPLPGNPWSIEERTRFVELLAEGHDAIPVIEALDHTELWERYLPEWTPVRNRPQRNAYHRFTVDRHLLEAAANAAGLVDRVDRPDLLLVGTLLHDIGKGRPGDHTEVGMELIAEIGPRLGFDAADTAVLVDLCRLHLLLPDVATRRDLSDPTTIAAVADEVGDRRRLALLAALTEADSLATGPAAWGRWKAELLGELVRRVDYHLDGGDPSVLSSTEFPDPDQRARMAEGRQVVEGADDLLTVIAADRRGLFSRVAGVLAIHGLQVRSADAASADGMAIEQFRVSSPTGTTIPWDRVVPQLDAAIAERLAIEARLADRVRTYRDREPSVRLPPPTVRFDDAASRVATVVEIHAPDRTGLLYRVTRTFADFGIDVTVAKVQTLGDVVVDAFYLQHPDGSLVTDPALRRELERAVLHAVT